MVELTNPDFQSVSVAYYCHAAPDAIPLTISPNKVTLNRPLGELTLEVRGDSLGAMVNANDALQAEISMQNAAGNNALTTVRQTSQTPAYYQLRQSGSDTQYFFLKRSDEASYEIDRFGQ